MEHLQNLAQLFSGNLADNILIETYQAQDLYLSSGKLLACDPLITNDKSPFIATFPRGNFPVFIHKEKESNCIAYVEIKFSDKQISRWELAICEGQDLKNLEEGEIFGYPVQSGMGSFMDADAQNALNHLENRLYHRKGVDFMGIYEEFFRPHFYDFEGSINQFAVIKPDDELEANIAAFETGYGDGFYASYIAFDSQNNPVKIISEFIEMI